MAGQWERELQAGLDAVRKAAEVVVECSQKSLRMCSPKKIKARSQSLISQVRRLSVEVWKQRFPAIL